MKRSDANALTVVELIKANRDTLHRIKRGDKSLSFNPVKGLKGEEYNVKDNSVLLITQIIEESSDCLKDGLDILKQAKQTFIGLHSEDE